MLDQLNALEVQTADAIALAQTPADIEALRIKTLGKKGELTLLLKNLGALAPEERKEMGKKANEVRDFIQTQLETARTRLEAAAQAEALVAEAMDITLPGRQKTVGHLHPVTSFMEGLEDLFISLGFDIVEGNFIETVYHNFD
ncbi:MAG: phenylalanine--tRNA ligase subunit alpha, partial [Defluviitaleaceae bacterium]|nr:phenylalanine--tRNA ligase subunit alpha [Defluviitaleaceae bacterium]